MKLADIGLRMWVAKGMVARVLPPTIFSIERIWKNGHGDQKKFSIRNKNPEEEHG